jgi:hypothetical protein
VFDGNFRLDSFEAVAADVDENGVIDTTDYLRIKAYFLNIYNLYE